MFNYLMKQIQGWLVSKGYNKNAKFVANITIVNKYLSRGFAVILLFIIVGVLFSYWGNEGFSMTVSFSNKADTLDLSAETSSNQSDESTEFLTPEPMIQPTAVSTVEPTPQPTAAPTPQPTATPTPQPTATPTPQPTAAPTPQPTAAPTPQPTATPTLQPTSVPVVTENTRFHATASSVYQLKNNQNDYSVDALMAVDGNLKTAWNEGGEGMGIGEWISLQPIDGIPRQYGGFRIANGFQYNDYDKGDRWSANGRVSLIRVYGDGREIGTFEILDVYTGYQTVYFPDSVYCLSLRFEILEAVKGEKFSETCISEIRPF